MKNSADSSARTSRSHFRIATDNIADSIGPYEGWTRDSIQGLIARSEMILATSS